VCWRRAGRWRRNHATDYAAEVSGLTPGEGVDIVLDPLGGHDWRKGLKLLRPCGRLVAYGFANLASGHVSGYERH
jgi:NADPH:quinone reductase-like Zn-dependent oxidoreductase